MVSLSLERLLLLKCIDHSILYHLRPIPVDPCQVLQGNICPPEHSSYHPLLYHLCHHPPPEQPMRKQKLIFTTYTGRPLLSQVCHVEPASIAP